MRPVTRLLAPRLLPVTIGVMSLLLVAKVAIFAGGLGSEAAAATSPVTQGAPAGATLSRPSQGGAPAEVSPAERSLLVDLGHKRDELDARERALDERAGILQAAQARLQEKIDHLAAAQARLQRLEDERKAREDASWKGIVKIYETMKPSDAAAIFDVLDMHVLLNVLDRMNERKAAAVMASMQPERARLATQMLAQMRIRRDGGGASDTLASRPVANIAD